MLFFFVLLLYLPVFLPPAPLHVLNLCEEFRFRKIWNICVELHSCFNMRPNRRHLKQNCSEKGLLQLKLICDLKCIKPNLWNKTFEFTNKLLQNKLLKSSTKLLDLQTFFGTCKQNFWICKQISSITNQTFEFANKCFVFSFIRFNPIYYTCIEPFSGCRVDSFALKPFLFDHIINT